MPIKLKKQFHHLFFNFNDIVIKINFTHPIDYNKYYALTKVVANSLIDFQTAKYLDSFSHDIIHIASECEKPITHEITLLYEIFKKILLNIKSDLKSFYKQNIIKYCHIPQCEKIHTHIEELVSSNSICKEMSVRQLHSSNNRKLIKFRQKLQDNNNSVTTTIDAINYYFNQLIKLILIVKPQ